MHVDEKARIRMCHGDCLLNLTYPCIETLQRHVSDHSGKGLDATDLIHDSLGEIRTSSAKAH